MDEIGIAVIGSATTIITALISVYPALSKEVAQRRRGTTRTQPTPRRDLAVLAGAFVAGVLLVLVGIGVHQRERARERAVAEANRMDSLLGSYRALIRAGDSAKRTMVIPTTVMFIRLERTSADPERIEADHRIVYQVHALRELTRNLPVFEEGFHATRSMAVDYVPGGDEERLTETAPQNKSWRVLFDLDVGARRTIITGAHSIYPNPLPANTSTHFYQRLGLTEDAFCYPNSASDVMAELVMFIESHSLDLRADPDIPAGIGQGQELRLTVPVHTGRERPGTPQHRVVSARFIGLAPGEVACMKVSW